MAKFHLAASFSVAEAADIANVPEDTFRTWHARNPTRHLGVKNGHRVWFSATEIFFYALVRDLVAFGVPVRAAMYRAAVAADAAAEIDGPLRDEIMIVRSGDEFGSMKMMSSCSIDDVKQTSLYVPLRAIWDEVMTKSRVVFAKAAA